MMPVLKLRSLILTKEEAAIVRVGLATKELRATLSPEGRRVLSGLIVKAEATLHSFPKEA